MECLDCVETAARLHLYIDRELSVEEIAIVQQHLDSCPQCDCRFHFDLSVKRLVHERCTIEKAPTHLRAEVLRIARSPVGSFDIDPAVEMELRADIAHSSEW